MEIKISEALWALSMMPEGILERWRVHDGAVVALGDAVAEVMIEGALHEVLAPSDGRLTTHLKPSAIVEPGTVIGDVTS
jgi:pyruvate/2-oxoglutarate dehydrogenase complex dihydrolipoamide acyltransferase (E2) component